MSNYAKLKTAVIYSGFTQKYICKKIGITPNMLYKYMAGIHNPKVHIAIKLCRVLGCQSQLEEIWGEEDDRPATKKKIQDMREL